MRRSLLFLAMASVATLFASDALAQPGRRGMRPRPGIERPELRQRIQQRLREATPPRGERAPEFRRGQGIRSFRPGALRFRQGQNVRPLERRMAPLLRGRMQARPQERLQNRKLDQLQRRVVRLERALRLQNMDPQRREAMRERLKERAEARKEKRAKPGKEGTPEARPLGDPPRRPGAFAPDREALRKRFDRDGDGQLSPEELTEARKAMRERREADRKPRPRGETPEKKEPAPAREGDPAKKDG